MADIDAKKVELLPCPFCGSPADIFYDSDNEANVFCTSDDCDAQIFGAKEARCIEKWNRRASLPLAGNVDALCKALLSYQQADADGVMVTVSRQACDEAASLISSLAGRVEAEKREREDAERERDRLRDVIERDRTKTAEIIGGIRAVVGRWSWLGEGRGSYAWDDDRYQDEFRQMLDALKEATDPLRALAADWTDCPQDYQAARIDWKARAEAAETHSAALAGALEEAKGVWKPISALWSKPAECGKGCPPRQVCDFCQRELFLGWNGDYVELWNTTNYYLCRERSEPHWKHMAEEAARLTHFMAFDMPDRARSLLAPKEDTDA